MISNTPEPILTSLEMIAKNLLEKDSSRSKLHQEGFSTDGSGRHGGPLFIGQRMVSGSEKPCLQHHHKLNLHTGKMKPFDLLEVFVQGPARLHPEKLPHSVIHQKNYLTV